jgi:hypothetical protein
MTIATQYNLVVLEGDDLAINFPFTFPVYTETDLLVYFRDKVTKNLLLVSSGDYTIDLGDENGGSVTFNTSPTSLVNVILARLTPLTQDLSVENQGGFYPVNFEIELDLLEMQMQQINEELHRTVRAPLAERFEVLPPPPIRRGQLLGFTDDEFAVPTVDTRGLLFNLLAAILVAGPGIEITIGDGIITITNTAIGVGGGTDQDAWLLEDAVGGTGGDNTGAEDVRDIIGTALRGLGCVIVVDDAANTITVDLTQDTTAEVIRDVVGAAIVAGAMITSTVSDVGNTVTLAVDTTVLDERIRDTAGAALVGGVGTTVTVDDAGNTITIDSAPKIATVVSAATVTPTFANDQVNITAQATGLTLANPTGTAVDGHAILIRIKDNGTSRAILYGDKYRAFGAAKPTATTISKTLYIGIVYNLADDKWDVLISREEV